jgi:hypothetical protein
VSHKFGQYGVTDQQSPSGQDWEFHDCGIVYYPNHPYHLCVMTKGPDLNALKKMVKGISQITYQEVRDTYK